jgi:hypothetical protein
MERPSKVVSAGSYTYSYDLSGVLRSAALPTSGDSVTYYLDGLNRRIGRETVWGSTKQYQYLLYDDNLRVAAELTSSNTIRSTFVYGTKPNVPDYMVQGTTVYRIISDWAGSVRLVVNVSSGIIAQQIDYDEFGNVISSTFYDSRRAPFRLSAFRSSPSASPEDCGTRTQVWRGSARGTMTRSWEGGLVRTRCSSMAATRIYTRMLAATP